MTIRFWRATKAKPEPELEDEALQLAQDGRLEVLLAVAVLEAEEIEEVRVAKDQVGREPVLVAELGQFPSRKLSGFFDRAVRSKSMPPILSRSVRTLQRSTRHISA